LSRSALRIWKGLLLPLVALLLALAPLAGSAAAADNKYAAIVYDANSGEVLFSKNADAKRYPASLTKIMTLYILFEELDAKRLSLSTKLTVSANAARQPPSKLGVKAGGSIKVEDAILALVTKSANDVAVVVAEAIGGDVSGFAERMNRTARALGMNSSTFRNPHGLPDNGQVTTARDLVRLAQAIQDNFPDYYPYFSKRSFTFRGTRIRNHNRLLGSVEGVDGIKTGYTRASGFNLVTNVDRDGRHVIAVVMGGRTASKRDAHMRSLIAKYLSKAERGARSTPLVIAESSADVDTAAEAVAALGDDIRVPRSRPDIETSDADVLAYAATEASDDIVGAAMAEAEDAVGDAEEPAEEDPIAARIQIASSVAEFADISASGDGPDPVAKLMQRARIRAGVEDVIAAPAAAIEAEGSGGWHIQIGAVPTEEGAEALLEKAQAAMGTALASLQPVTQPVEHHGDKLYRARFAGLSDKAEARALCTKLKSKDFSCLAVPN
jgi:D-alanyl-D-alanine carboxypeptidase